LDQHALLSVDLKLLDLLQIPFHEPKPDMQALPGESAKHCNGTTNNPEESSWWIPLSYTVKVSIVAAGVGFQIPRIDISALLV
jgi:hypothetical protein